MFQHFRPLYQGHLIANVDMTQERANRLIEARVNLNPYALQLRKGRAGQIL
jgi:3-phenylpropionate/cinnamic acid dioxygenase small subunit